MKLLLLLLLFPLAGCHKKPVHHLPKVNYRVYVNEKTCTLQPDNSYVCKWVRLDPQEVAAK